MLLCMDIGGTAVKLGLVDEDGRIHARHEASVSFDGYRTPIIETTLKEAEAFLSGTGVAVAGIGVSATGQVDDSTGTVIGTNGKIPSYEGTCIKARLEERFHVPAQVINDANAAALGECFRGGAQGVDNVVMITLGTGVGGGIISNGQLLSGKRGIAGELGHFTLYQDGPCCPCGKRGCYENYASTTALVQSAGRASGDQTLTGREIFARAASGDAVMLRAIDAWLHDVAAGLTGIIHIFNPEMVLIGGGVSSQEELLMQPLRRLVRSGVMPRFAEGLRIERALLGNDAGLIGAAKNFLDTRR